MELISTDDFFILQPVQRGENNLWVSRHDGRMEMRASWDLASQDNPECLGLVWGLVGKLRIHQDLLERLVLVRRCQRLGDLPGRHAGDRHGVYKVESVVTLPIVVDNAALAGLGLKPCPKHQPCSDVLEIPRAPQPHPSSSDSSLTTLVDGQSDSPMSSSSTNISGSVGNANTALAKIGGSLKSLASDAVKTTAGNAVALASQVKVPWNAKTSTVPLFFKSPSTNRALERFERRIVDEFTKMFHMTDSFFFSYSGDLTNSLQRQMAMGEEKAHLPLWKRVDDRFFFNKYLLQGLIDLDDSRADPFIIPLIQGFVEMQFAPLELEMSPNQVVFSGLDHTSDSEPAVANGLPDFYTIALISRRSRHRAGTRYKRRGVDAEGFVANYVETEQIVMYHDYCLSFVMTRGSVPIFWSQPGYKYRPPPRLDRTETEDSAAFAAHFRRELDTYGHTVTCLSLVERTGREKPIADAFLRQAALLDDPDLGLVAFDFHEHCRGMHFENVSILMSAIEELVRAVRYCWVDRQGMVCRQQGVLRVNCMDCLDRTNVVQTAVARNVLENQLTKLGVLSPEQSLTQEARNIFQSLWANNGDVISRQYAGTNALKGDFTRTGERNLSGMMKDGVNSANRYYLNQFRDAYRQAAIDLMTGNEMSSEVMIANEDDPSKLMREENDNAAIAEQVKVVIEDCKKLLIPDLDSIVGAWGLIDNDPVTGDAREEDMDVIFILTKDSYYVARYDDETDKITQYQKVLLSNVEKVEFGVPDTSFSMTFARNQSKPEHSMRILYRMPSEDVEANDSGYFHMFRSTNLRFFNNMALVIRNDEEKIESLKSVADSVSVAIELAGLVAEAWFGRLEKRRSKLPSVHSGFNVFEHSDNGSGKSSGTKALLSVTSQFSKLNPISKLRSSVRRQNPASEPLKSNPQPGSSDPDPSQVDDEKISDYDLRNDSVAVVVHTPSVESEEKLDMESTAQSPPAETTKQEQRSCEGSPVLSRKENVLASFSKITRGIQSLGNNLRSPSSSSLKSYDKEDSDEKSATIEALESQLKQTKTKIIIL